MIIILIILIFIHNKNRRMILFMVFVSYLFPHASKALGCSWYPLFDTYIAPASAVAVDLIANPVR